MTFWKPRGTLPWMLLACAMVVAIAIATGKAVHYRQKYYQIRAELRAAEAQLIAVVEPPSNTSVQARPLQQPELPLNATPALQPPTADDLLVDADEDAEYLRSILSRPLGDDPQQLSQQQIALRLLRFVPGALRLKSNSGTATSILQDGYAICGGMAIVYEQLARLANVPARRCGLMNLPVFGSHAVAECWFDDGWRLMDPTNGVFFASSPDFPRTGHILSLHELLSGDTPWTMFKVIDKPWQGLDDLSGDPPILAVEENYLREQYGVPLLKCWRAAPDTAFPVFYLPEKFMACPVNADLTTATELKLGTADRDAYDMLLLTTNSREVGGHYLGSGDPAAGHTLLITTAEPSIIEIEYHSIHPDFGALNVLPLAALHITAARKTDTGWLFTAKMQTSRAAAMITCPFGERFSIDAIAVRRVRPAPSLASQPSAP
jgi:hypothetical protein